MKKRNYPKGHPAPGAVGAGKMKLKKKTPYAVKLSKFQLIKGFYGNLSTKRLKRIVEESQKASQHKPIGSNKNAIKVDPIKNTFAKLERTLSTAVWRVWAPSVYAARQWISHRHVKVNGKKITYSYILQEGDSVSISKEIYENPHALRVRSQREMDLPSYISVENDKLSFKVVAEPTVELAKLPQGMDVKAVVEMLA